jgi:hypothetical protein
MAVDIVCNGDSHNCSIACWVEFRSIIIKASFEYLKTHLNNKKFENSSKENINKNDILEMIHRIESQILNTPNSYEPNLLIKAFSISCGFNTVDTLIYFGVGGLFAFCHKYDVECYYSVGNSYDICELFKLIEPFFKKFIPKDSFFEKHFEKINVIFQNSVEFNKIVLVY